MNRCSTARRSYRYSLRYSCDARDIGFPAKFANCCPVVLKGRQIERRERVGVSILNHGETSVESQSFAKRWDTRERSFPLSLDYFTEKDYPTIIFRIQSSLLYCLNVVIYRPRRSCWIQRLGTTVNTVL